MKNISKQVINGGKCEQFTSAYTTQQHSVIKKIETFLHSEDLNIFLLKGYAGTGKTFLLGGVVKMFMNSGWTVRLLAPTGRAARILGLKTGEEANTIHKVIYTQSNVLCNENDPGVTSFSLSSNTDPLTTLYIVDEASMVSDRTSFVDTLKFGSGRLLKDLISYVEPARTGRKIIFCGDPAQLPPVNMDVSPALSSAWLKRLYRVNTGSSVLTEVQRQQKDNPIVKYAARLRYRPDNSCNKRVSSSVIPDDRTIFFPTYDNAMKKYAHEITQHDIPRTIWICHSNRGAESVNLEIRSYLSYYRKNLNPGEILMIRRNSYYYNTWLLNGDLARVRDISDRSEAVDVVYNFRDEKNLVIKLVFRDAIISPLHESDVRLRVKILENGLIKNAASLQKIQAALHVYAMKRYKSEKPPVNFDMYRKGDVYFNSLHVGYGYAITCHKAQGGEWEQVIADMKHSLGPLSNGFRRWAYTAVTRASGRLLVLNPVKQADFLVDHTRFDPLRFRIDDTHSEVVSTIQSTVCDHLKLPKPVNGESRKAMYRTISSLARSLDISVHRVDVEPGCDLYVLKTDTDGTRLACYYDSENKIKSVTPVSHTWIEDKKLNELVAGLSSV